MQTALMKKKECSAMKSNLILSLALLALSIPSFAATEPKPCDNNKQDSSMQSKDQKHNKKQKKEKKQRTEPQQESNGFSIYG
jgi:hypothetical protein